MSILMNNQEWVYECIVRDINIHTNEYILDVTNPQYKWQERGITVRPRFVQPRPVPQVGDRVDVIFLSQGVDSSSYEIDKVYPTDTPRKPTYEIVNQGRWYDKYLCCSLASKSEKFCVCSIVVECPVHGGRHIGTHD